MARIRSIHPGLFTDEAFVSVSMEARILLIGLWTDADDAGIFEWKPRRLKIRLLPADDADVDKLLDELVSVDSVAKFEVNGRGYGAIRNFCKWQRPRTPEFQHPRGDMESYVALHDREARDQSERGTALGKILSERQGHVCYYCGNGITAYRKKANSLEIDHVMPVSRGGSDDIANLCAACKPCNQLKANMSEDEFRKRFAVSELLQNSISRLNKQQSQSAKPFSQDAKHPNDERPPQMEDGGDKMEEEGGNKEEVVPPLPREADRETMVEALEAYNGLAAELSLPTITKFSANRRSKLAARLRDCGGIAGWKAALAKIRGSPFCLGDNDRGWKADFDFLLQEQSFIRLMEGRYDDRGTGNGRAQASRGAGTLAASLAQVDAVIDEIERRETAECQDAG